MTEEHVQSTITTSIGDFSGSASDSEPDSTKESQKPDAETLKYKNAASDSDSAVATPTVDESPVDECLVFDVSGDWGHFRKPNVAAPRLTYGIPPRTTITGLMAAVQGYARDSYYQLFLPENSRVAVGVKSPIRKKTIPQNYLDTEGTKVTGAKPGKKITENRQQISMEYVVNPTYRVYVSVDSTEFMDTLEKRLQTSSAHYTPSLGNAECLASLDFVGRFGMEDAADEDVTIHSTIPYKNPDVVVEKGKKYVSDRFPRFFTVTGEGERVPGEWHHLTFDASGGPVTLREAEYTVVGDDNVMFG